MENTEQNVFTAKTVDDAIEAGLTALGITREQAEITVIEEGKKKLFGGVKAKVKVEKRASDGTRAAKFIDGLFDVLKINAFSEIVADGDTVEIRVQASNSHQIIGRHGEILDAIQTIAGAVANIGNEEYKKVVVDCENYRENREKTLIELANKLAKKAVERGKKVTLEPMNPYERRIIHAALADNEEVKTVSDGREPNRYVVIIPKNLKPYEGGDRPYNGRPRGERGNRPYNGNRGGDRPYNNRPRGDRRERFNNNNGDRPSAPRQARPARGKKEIRFGTYLGNSGAGASEAPATENTDKTEE